MPTDLGHTLAVIPARLGSTRLPRKVLRELAGRPMIAWIYRAARACPLLDQVLIATDSDEVLDFCSSHNLPAIFTPPECPSGTDRVHAVAQAIRADIYVNIQGDEPLLTPEHFQPLLDRAVAIGNTLGLHTLGRIDDQQGALAGSQRTRHLV